MQFDSTTFKKGENPMKFYSCIICFWKKSENQIVHRYAKAVSTDAALKLILTAPDIIDLLLDGYNIDSKHTQEVDASIVPYNNDKAFTLTHNSDNAPEAVYIRVDGEYDDGFKRGLQALLSKYCPELPTVFEECVIAEPDSDMRWFLEFRSKYTDWRNSLYTSPDGCESKLEAQDKMKTAQKQGREIEYRLIEREGKAIDKPKTRWFLQFFHRTSGKWLDSACGHEESYLTRDEVPDIISDDAGNYRAVEREVSDD